MSPDPCSFLPVDTEICITLLRTIRPRRSSAKGRTTVRTGARSMPPMVDLSSVKEVRPSPRTSVTAARLSLMAGMLLSRVLELLWDKYLLLWDHAVGRSLVPSDELP